MEIFEMDGSTSLRGTAGDEAISFSDRDCFAPLAMTEPFRLLNTCKKGNKEAL
jgi:hypothetical protein